MTTTKQPLKPKRDYRIFNTNIHWYSYLFLSNKWIIASQIALGTGSIIRFSHNTNYFSLILGIMLLFFPIIKLFTEKRMYLGVDYR